MNNKLEEIVLLSGNDIPFLPAQVNIHQPRIKEIAYIGEEIFFQGCQLLNFSKDMLSEEDKIHLADTDDFDILMSILCNESASIQKIAAHMILTLMFPDYEIQFFPDKILLQEDDNISNIDKSNFKEFKEILVQVFALEKSEKDAYNPANDKAKEIAEKLKKGRQKLAVEQGKAEKISVLSRYISILAVGLQKDINNLFEYTVYQLFDEFTRFQLYFSYDINIKARLAGATDLDEPKNWMDDIHS